LLLELLYLKLVAVYSFDKVSLHLLAACIATILLLLKLIDLLLQLLLLVKGLLVLVTLILLLICKGGKLCVVLN